MYEYWTLMVSLIQCSVALLFEVTRHHLNRFRDFAMKCRVHCGMAITFLFKCSVNKLQNMWFLKNKVWAVKTYSQENSVEWKFVDSGSVHRLPLALAPPTLSVFVVIFTMDEIRVTQSPMRCFLLDPVRFIFFKSHGAVCLFFSPGKSWY